MNKRGMKEGVLKVFSFFITLGILGLLIISGPAQAFTLNIEIPETKAIPGDQISFIVSLNIDSGERLPVDYLKLDLFGPENIACRFLANGTAIAGCSNITITQVSLGNYTFGNLNGNYSGTGYNWGYGYGFGYGYGGFPETLAYNITINASDLEFGIYETFLKVQMKANQFSQRGANITIVEPINITDLINDPACAYEGDRIKVSANITGSVKEVLVEKEISGKFTNYTTTRIGNTYSALISGDGGKNMSWRFIAKDIADDLTYGDWNSMYIFSKTRLVVYPALPDGWNQWYITEPIFIIENPDASEIYYQWDSDNILTYPGFFGLENIPNSPPKESAGILELNYWANNSCRLEEKQNKTFYVDLTNPQFKNLKPADKSFVYTAKPEISVYLDEVYQSNSGIDKSSVVMKLDGVIVNAGVFDADSIDAIATYVPKNELGFGMHNVSVYVKDNAGRENETFWGFEVKYIENLSMTINSPGAIEYDSKRVEFDIELNREVNLEYINWNDNKPRWRTLCKNCDEYGNSRKKTKTLNEGENNLSIRATNGYGYSIEENMVLFIDSKPPKISKIEPRKNSVVNGSVFYIKYTEDNLQKIELFWNGSKLLENCSSGKNQECKTDVNLSEYNEKWIEYYFNVSDGINTVESKKTRVFVDTTIPELTIENPKNTNYGRKVPWNITISESVSLEYYDKQTASPRWKTLCTRCDEYGNSKKKTKGFTKGFHDILIRATDKAGNSIEEEISFDVSY